MMTDVIVGTEIPSLELPPISRYTLALFAGASGDHNPIHIDSDFAKQAGMPDVFAHGMLSMAYLARLLTDWKPQSSLRKFSTHFAAITQLHDVVTCSGTVVEIIQAEGETLARCEININNQDGATTLVGEALVAL